jgi:hypothetical protein
MWAICRPGGMITLQNEPKTGQGVGASSNPASPPPYTVACGAPPGLSLRVELYFGHVSLESITVAGS